MDGEVNTKHSYKHNKNQKKKQRKYIVMLVAVILIGSMICIAPVKHIMAMGFERVLIYIDEYTSLGEKQESKMPVIKNLKLELRSIEDFEDYTSITASQQDLHSGNMVLVNGNYSWQLGNGSTLVKVADLKNTSYKLMDDEMLLNKEMIIALNKMMQAFEKATGKHDLILTSGYRTYKEQEKILYEKINLLGEDEALEWAMLPGYSEHHTGYAVDMSIYTDQGNYIKYKGQDEYAWINQNCYKYGLIRRYSGNKATITGVNNEEWHYRYVGVPHSYIMSYRHFCYEEYIEYLRKYTNEQKHLWVKCGQGKYEIYFVPYKGEKTEIKVPKDEAYNVSGNNVDGYIVTIEK